MSLNKQQQRFDDNYYVNDTVKPKVSKLSYTPTT